MSTRIAQCAPVSAELRKRVTVYMNQNGERPSIRRTAESLGATISTIEAILSPGGILDRKTIARIEAKLAELAA